MPDEQLLPVEKKADADRVHLTAKTPLRAAFGGFREHMEQRDLTENTRKSFMYDLNILAKFVGPGRPVGEIATKDLKDYVEWLQHGRGVPCNQKSLARRITSLKVFFLWLAEQDVIPTDPAAPIPQKPVTTPLADILFDSQVEQFLATTNMLRHGEKPDARPHLLVTLLLATGIKKSECVALVLNHLDFSDPQAPAVWIRYGDARHQHKERKLKLPVEWPRILEEYKAQVKINDKIFACTARNLEYVLRAVSALAGLKQVSFEMLRWTCAVRDYKNGMSEELLRHKLGLSRMTWEEAGEKIKRLAAPAL